MAIKILVVDDDGGVRRDIAEYLGAKGYEIAEAADGEEALASFRSVRHDAIITDIRMPRMDGVELCRRVQQMDPHCPVIVFTGDYSDECEQRAREAGARAVLKKPISLRELIETLALLVENH